MDTLHYFIQSNFLVAHDSSEVYRGEKDILLERYFNDIFKLFLNKLNGIAMGEKLSVVEQEKMKKLLDEIIKVRGLLERKSSDSD